MMICFSIEVQGKKKTTDREIRHLENEIEVSDFQFLDSWKVFFFRFSVFLLFHEKFYRDISCCVLNSKANCPIILFHFLVDPSKQPIRESLNQRSHFWFEANKISLFKIHISHFWFQDFTFQNSHFTFLVSRSYFSKFTFHISCLRRTRRGLWSRPRIRRQTNRSLLRWNQGWCFWLSY